MKTDLTPAEMAMYEVALMWLANCACVAGWKKPMKGGYALDLDKMEARSLDGCANLSEIVRECHIVAGRILDGTIKEPEAK